MRTHEPGGSVTRNAAKEILEQIAAAGHTQVGAFVCGAGTGGTISGVGRRLKELHAGTQIGELRPETAYGPLPLTAWMRAWTEREAAGIHLPA